MRSRRWPPTVFALTFGERLVEQYTTRHESIPKRREQRTIEIASHDNEMEVVARERQRGQVGTHQRQVQSLRACSVFRAKNDLVLNVDPDRVKASRRHQQAVASATGGDIEGSRTRRELSVWPRDPASDERRRWIGREEVGHTQKSFDIMCDPACIRTNA